MCVTFSNKAAKEMQKRAAAILGEDEDLFFSGAWINTFHSLSNKILRRDQNYEFVGLTADYHILDDADQQRLIKELLKENFENENILMDIVQIEKLQGGKNVDITQVPYGRIAGAIDQFKNSCIFPGENEKLNEDCSDFDIAVFNIVYKDY